VGRGGGAAALGLGLNHPVGDALLLGFQVSLGGVPGTTTGEGSSGLVSWAGELSYKVSKDDSFYVFIKGGGVNMLRTLSTFSAEGGLNYMFDLPWTATPEPLNRERTERMHEKRTRKGSEIKRDALERAAGQDNPYRKRTDLE